MNKNRHFINVDDDDEDEISNGNQFTDQEIREQLNCLGFKNIPQEKFNQFKNDLEKLISSEISMNSSSLTDSYMPSDTTGFKYSHQKNSLTDNINEQYLMRNNTSKIAKKVSFIPDVKDPAQKNNREGFDEYEESEDDQSFASVTTTTSSIIDNKVIKRKIVRKTAVPSNSVKILSNDLNDLNENFNKMKFPVRHELDETNETIEDEIDQDSDVNDCEEDELIRMTNINNQGFDDDDDGEYEAYSGEERIAKLNDCYPAIEYPVKSFIRSQSSLSNKSTKFSIDTSRLATKTNPMQKFHQYKKFWNNQKTPGEKSHNDLRWSIREQMLEKHVFVKKPSKPISQNKYIVPTDKKRQQLRWMVRSALANPI
jgi:hydrolethalus syndrome protein 1